MQREIEIDSESVEENGVTTLTQQAVPEQGKWKKNIDFLFACLGFSVGFGNVWRFPYLCFKNGGGAFLIPYFISVLVTGIPMFFLEVSVGQLMSRGGIEAWEIIPLFKGVGYAGMFILFCLNCYYSVILAWIFFYLFSSMQKALPWSACTNAWNTPHCAVAGNASANVAAPADILLRATDPANEYWERRVLEVSSGIEDIGIIRWELALCLLLAWIVVVLCICRGIRASGKVLYITATAPFVLLVVLLIRTALLDGARGGMIYYMKPDWEKLLDFEVWSDAGTQIFFSYSISLGTLTALGGFNNFHHNTLRDTALFATLNSFASFVSGCIIFCTLGYMSETSGIPIKDVAESGPGLAFVAYPKALTTLPLSPLWSVLFFCMLLLLGLDSQFVGVEGLVSSLADMFPHLFSARRPRLILLILTSCVSYLVGLIMVTNGGIYIFQIFDYYVGCRIILLLAMLECIVIGFVFGAQRFASCLRKMYQMQFYWFPTIIYCGIVPWFSVALFVLSVFNKKLQYRHSYGIYDFPQYSVVIGWCLASCSVAFIPMVAIYRITNAKGSLWQRIKDLCQPNLTESALRHLEASEASLPNLSDRADQNIFSTMEIDVASEKGGFLHR